MGRITDSKFRTLFLLVIMLAQVSCTDWFADEQQMMQKAAELLSARSMNAAAIELRNVLQANPGNAEARYLLAGIYEDYGDFATAEKEFRHAELAGWNPEQTRVGIARCYIGTGRFQVLLDALEPDAAWRPAARADLMALRAVSEAGLGSLTLAEQVLGRAIQLVPDTLQVMKAGVQLAMIAGRQDDARKLLELAMEKYPDNPELLLLHAGQLAASDQTDQAQAVYQQVIDQDPQNFMTAFGRNARLRLAQIQTISGDLDAAKRTIGPLLRRDPNDPFTNYLNGLIAYQQSEFQQAEQSLLKVLKLAPEHNPTRLLFGTVNYAEKNYEQAAYFLGKYIAAVPDNLVVRKLLARSYILLGRPEEASTVLQGVMSDDSTDSELLALVGISDLERGERVAGIAGLEKALKASPGDLALRTELARAYIDTGETGLAIHELQSMLAEGGQQQQQTATLLVLAHLRAGEFGEAISIVLNMLNKEPGNALTESLAGNVFASSGDRVEARKHLGKALEIEPGLPPAMLSLAQIEEIEGHLDAATELYQQLIDQNLDSALPMLAMARIAEKKNDRQGMLDWLEKALEHAPNDVKPRLFLAEFHLRNGEPEKARPLADKALEIAPKEPEVLVLMARVLLARQQYWPALEVLDKLLVIEPDSVVAHSLRGEAYMQLKHMDDARRELQIALDNEPGNVNTLVLLTRIEILDHNYKKSFQYSKRIQEAYPQLYLGYELNGDVAAASGKLGDAAQQYALAWDRLPSEELVIKRANIASLNNNHTAAASYLQKWLAGHPDAVRVQQFLGNTWQSMGKSALAIEQYEKVLQADPKNRVALNNLAVLYQTIDRVKAMQLAEQAWRLDPSDPGIQDTYGWLLVQHGQLERGRPLLDKAVAVLGNVPEVRYHHAVAVYRAGDREQGKALLQSLLSDEPEFEGRAEAQRLLKDM